MASPDSHLLLSTNKAAGLSLNFSPRLTCARKCPFCYATKRTKRQASLLCTKHGLPPGTITANTGPITWPTQQAAYERNTSLLRRAGWEQIREEAQRLDARLRRRGYDNIRINGCGDFFAGSVLLTHELAKLGIRVWGFSRRPEMIDRLTMLGNAFRSAGYQRPVIWGSVDRLTSLDRAEDIARACVRAHLHRTNRVLAYMALPGETAESIKAQRLWPYVHVVLGYHATGVHTKVGIPRECPKTAGKGVVCQDCKRCQGRR